MKFKNERPLATPGAAEKKLPKIANAMEANHSGRLVRPASLGLVRAGGPPKPHGLPLPQLSFQVAN